MKMDFRPFRTSAIALGFMLLAAMTIVLAFNHMAMDLQGYTQGFVDGTVIAITLTAYATGLTKLCDDGGDSDAIKVLDRVKDWVGVNGK